MLANGSISAYNIQIVLIVFNRKTHVPNAYIQQLHACKDAKADWVKREKTIDVVFRTSSYSYLFI